MDYEIKSVCDLVRTAEDNYINGTTTIGKYVEFSQYENIEKITAYLNSKHISGDTDSMGREKPFYNIARGAANIWWRATDIDRKNIRIKADKRDNTIPAYLASVHLWDWMKRSGFGRVLNEWGYTLACYGSAVMKFVESNGKLTPSVIPWNRLISDTIDFENNPKIEILYLTPAQLLQNKSYDKEMVKQLLDARSSREDLSGQKKDNISDYIKVYEIHGELPLSLLTENEEDNQEYRQQMHVVSFVGHKSRGRKTTEYDDYTLYKGRESKDPYFLTTLIREDGRAQGIGAVEHLFEAQWMANHTVKEIKDQLDLASKLIFQTSDGNYVGRNVLNSIENGDILIHSVNEPLTQIANNSHDITALQNFGTQWSLLAKEITSTPDSISGNTMPAGTAYRQVAILNQESHSLFEIMTENKGLAIEEMMRKYIIPYLKKQMDTTKEISVALAGQGIEEFDAMYVPVAARKAANNIIKDNILNGMLASPVDEAAIAAQVKGELGVNNPQRFIKPSDIPSKTWKEVMEDLEWEVDVEVTPENIDKEVTMTTLTTVLQTIASNPMILQDPNTRMLFNKILEETGKVSPVQLAQVAAQPQPGMMGAPLPEGEEVGQAAPKPTLNNPNAK